MRNHNVICDKCKLAQQTTTAYEAPKDWLYIQYTKGSGIFRTQIEINLCPNCKVELKVADFHTIEQPEAIAGQLINILTEIAREAVQQ